MPRISVLIPTYNRAANLARCLRSVTACSLPDLEILVADNASPDATPDVLTSFNDPRIRSWRNETNLGPERNVCNLLEAGRGDWLFFLTDDDQLLSGALERLLEMARAHPQAGVILSSVKQQRANGSDLPDHHFAGREGLYAAGPEALVVFVQAAHILSRLALRRELVDLAGTRRQIGTMYLQMFAVGSVVKDHPGFYTKECLVEHTVGNPTFWQYTTDFMVGARIGLIMDLLPGSRWRAARRALIRQLLDGVYRSHFPQTWASGDWFRHQRALLQIPALRFSPRHWFQVGRFLLADARRLKKKRKKKSA